MSDKTFADIEKLFKMVIGEVCDSIVKPKHDHGSEYIQKIDSAMADIVTEYYRACRIHPVWPNDLIHQVAIMQEEAGESIREALRIEYKEGACMDDLKKELVQTGAMVLRVLMNLKD